MHRDIVHSTRLILKSRNLLLAGWLQFRSASSLESQLRLDPQGFAGVASGAPAAPSRAFLKARPLSLSLGADIMDLDAYQAILIQDSSLAEAIVQRNDQTIPPAPNPLFQSGT